MIYVSDTTRIRFRHTIPTEGTWVYRVSPEIIPHRISGATQCMIETKNGDGEWGTWQDGEAVCSLSDSFQRSVGRKIALTRALVGVEPKSLRKDFWEAYFRKVKR